METMAPKQQPAWMKGIISTLFVLGLLQVIYAFTGAFAVYGIYYPAANVLLIILMFAALAGLSSMEKWGLWLFLTFTVLKLVLDIWTGAFHYAELLLILPVFLFFYKKADLS
jgi:hypothetical protein